MRKMQTVVLVLACFSPSLACDADQGMGVFAEGPDGAVATLPDASLSEPADASPPIVPDAAEESTPPDPFPISLACSLDDVQPILGCVTDNCLDAIADGTLLTCVTFSCGLLLLTLPPDCSECIVSGLANPTGALDACVDGLDDLGGGFPVPPAP